MIYIVSKKNTVSQPALFTLKEVRHKKRTSPFQKPANFIMSSTTHLVPKFFQRLLLQDLLSKIEAETVIVMDNASFHKRKDMIEAITKKDVIQEYLPL